MHVKSYPEKSSMNKGNKCAACRYSLFTQCSLDKIRSKHDYYTDKDCIKIFYKYLIEHLMKITNFERLKNGNINRKRASLFISKDFVIYEEIN